MAITMKIPKNTDEMLHGRGLSIIKSFSQTISFAGNGKNNASALSIIMRLNKAR